MIIAILDLGTNTFHCLIVEIKEDGTYKKLYKTKTSVKLGEGGINKNTIAPIPFKRGIVALRMFNAMLRKYSIDKLYAYGTAALRSAKNAKDFVKAVKDDLNIDVEIISGEKEAEYIYYGVRQALDMGKERSLIIDIGGGSVEFIIANKNQIFWKHSYNLGAARLLEQFNPSDPITPLEIKKIEQYLEKSLSLLFVAIKKFPTKILIGSSGSFDTFAEMIAHDFFTPKILQGKTEYEFLLDLYDATHQKLIKSTHSERLHTKGIIQMRVDMIVVASIFTNFIIKKLKIRRMLLSTYALKEGVLWEAINENIKSIKK